MVAERRPTSSSLARIPIIIAAIIMFSTHPSMSSVGDRLHYYNKCFSLCRQTNCSTNADIRTFNARQSRYLLWMGWNCPEECRYQCQWRTVTHLMRIGKPLPQFYGKVSLGAITSDRITSSNLFLFSGHLFAGTVWKSRRLSFFL